jgi:23S rRNA (uridine2552-2'-O)-methyltransferase
MSGRWARQRRDDPYWRAAKRTGYRSRAAFKLQQIVQRYGVVRRGFVVVDLGAAPGGWTQVALEVVGEAGAVVAVDLSRVAPMPGARVVRGDVTAPGTLEAVRREVRAAREGQPGAHSPDRADVVLSDMSPNISGIYSLDQARSIILAGRALDAARELLRPGGHLVVKVFEGEDFKQFLEAVRGEYGFVKVYNPPASRKQSSEVYVIAKARKRNRAASRRGRGTREEE